MDIDCLIKIKIKSQREKHFKILTLENFIRIMNVRWVNAKVKRHKRKCDVAKHAQLKLTWQVAKIWKIIGP